MKDNIAQLKDRVKIYVLAILKFFAQAKIKKLNPVIIGITSSVGKTSAKEAIADVLERRLKIKKSQKNYNSEFGVTLTILDLYYSKSSPLEWIRILWTAVIQHFKKPEPCDAFVLEMGIDKPGDMDEILDVFSPNIMVFLNVKDAHLAEGQFPNRQAIYEEKAKAVLAVPKEGWAVLNIDDPFVKLLDGNIPAKCVSIGESADADIRAENIKTTDSGLSFDVIYDSQKMAVKMPNVLGDCHVLIALSAIAVGFIQGLPWSAIEKGLEEFHLPPGRMNKIEGLNDSLLIDSSYNASPATMEAGLDVLDKFHGRKIACLGGMNELGELTDSAHLKLGKQASEVADVLIAVGDQAKNIAEGAQRGGMSASMIHVFQNSREAGEFLSKILSSKDVVLVKGSQNGVRMEHLTKACMKYPEEARQKLIRQEPYWMTKL